MVFGPVLVSPGSLCLADRFESISPQTIGQPGEGLTGVTWLPHKVLLLIEADLWQIRRNPAAMAIPQDLPAYAGRLSWVPGVVRLGAYPIRSDFYLSTRVGL
jgi:hypothetical protein